MKIEKRIQSTKGNRNSTAVASNDVVKKPVMKKVSFIPIRYDEEGESTESKKSLIVNTI